MAVSFINAPDPGISSPSGSSNSHNDQNIFARLAGEALGSLATSAVGVGLKRLFEPDYADLAKSQGLVPSDYKGALEAGPYTALGNQHTAITEKGMPSKQLNLTPQEVDYQEQVPRTNTAGQPVYQKDSTGMPVAQYDPQQAFAMFDPATGEARKLPLGGRVPAKPPLDVATLPKADDKMSAAQARKDRTAGPDRSQDSQIVAQRVFMVRQATDGRNVKPDDVDRYFGGMGNFNKAVEDYKVFRSARGQ